MLDLQERQRSVVSVENRDVRPAAHIAGGYPLPFYLQEAGIPEQVISVKIVPRTRPDNQLPRPAKVAPHPLAGDVVSAVATITAYAAAHLPAQMRSAASQTTITASRTASS